MGPDEDQRSAVGQEAEPGKSPTTTTTTPPPPLLLFDGDVDRSIMIFIDRGMHGQALGLMMSAYGERIGRFFSRRVARREQVDDLTQETFVRAMQGLANFRGESRVLTWLTRIAYNVMHTSHHRQRRHSEDHARYMDLQQAEASSPTLGERPDQKYNRQELARAIDGCFERLNDVVRELALLVWVEGHTFVEAAEITGMTEDAVRKRLCRARPLLQRCLELQGVVGGSTA